MRLLRNTFLFSRLLIILEKCDICGLSKFVIQCLSHDDVKEKVVVVVVSWEKMLMDKNPFFTDHVTYYPQIELDGITSHCTCSLGTCVAISNKTLHNSSTHRDSPYD